MSIFIVQLGSPRKRRERLRVGTVRRPPRGIPKEQISQLDYYDVWFPNLAPSAALVKDALTAEDQPAWNAFERKFRREMKRPEANRDLDLLAALSHYVDFSVGCYCEDETRCHRSVLRSLLKERGADIT